MFHDSRWVVRREIPLLRTASGTSLKGCPHPRFSRSTSADADRDPGRAPGAAGPGRESPGGSHTEKFVASTVTAHAMMIGAVPSLAAGARPGIGP
eukprot:753225-Hanusia_phi.AAC.2